MRKWVSIFLTEQIVRMLDKYLLYEIQIKSYELLLIWFCIFDPAINCYDTMLRDAYRSLLKKYTIYILYNKLKENFVVNRHIGIHVEKNNEI